MIGLKRMTAKIQNEIENSLKVTLGPIAYESVNLDVNPKNSSTLIFKCN